MIDNKNKMTIENAFENGRMAFYENCPFSKSIYAPDSLLEYAFIKGYQYAKSTMINESCQEEIYENDDEFFLNYGWIRLNEAKGIYQGKEVELNKPMKGDVKRSKVYVNSGDKVEHDGKQRIRAKKVNFGSKEGSDLRVRSSKEARKNFAARHNCDDAKDKTTAKYWSCRKGKEKHGGTYW